MFLKVRETFWKKIGKIKFSISHNRDKFLRKLFLPFETLKYASIAPPKKQYFWIVSCERNLGEAAIKCIESVYKQKYARGFIKHLFIDDASTDNTDRLISKWLEKHPDHNVEYISNKVRAGGTANTIRGFRMAPPDSIVLEVNGDDWLPDNDLLDFLNKVYDDPNIWMTYNTFMYSDGRSPEFNHPYPRKVVESGDYRRYEKWVGQHLHSFRKKLFSHLKEETFIDPQTGKYWESADDQAIYLSMLELAGKHAKHIYRTTYIYNYHESADNRLDHAGSVDRAARIRQMNKYSPLDCL